jgi:hypothetical protein
MFILKFIHSYEIWWLMVMYEVLSLGGCSIILITITQKIVVEIYIQFYVNVRVDINLIRQGLN